MKYAIIQLGGKQMKVSEGDIFEIERQEKLNIAVLLFSENGTVQIGEPILADIEVTAKVVEDKMDKKVRIARYKSKSRYRKKKGHRQPISVVKIEKIGKKGASKDAKVEAVAKAKPSAKKTTPKAKENTAKVKPTAKKKEAKG